MKKILAIQGAWLLLLFSFGVWWVILILRLGHEIFELEQKLGIPLQKALETWTRTRRTILWESGTFFLLLFALLAFVFYTHWRDLVRNRAVRAFFASLTHELRTPLAGIRLQAESLFDRMGSEAPTNPLLSRMLEDVSRLENQVNRALELARIEQGGEVSTSSVDLSSWTKRFLRAHAVSFGDLVDARFPLQEKPIWIQSDPHSLEIIFRNLIENAVRHGGVNHDQKLSMEAGLNSEGKPYLLTWDRSAGVPEKFLKKAGTLFYKGAKSQGAGVGLYLMRSLVEKMGGSVSFSNRSPQGFQTEMIWKKAQEET